MQTTISKSSPPTAAKGLARGVIANVQALRALAATLVVIVHLEALAIPAGLTKATTEMFGVGVDLFFVISGFIMVYTNLDKETYPRAFLWNRITRIVPLYWLVTLGVFTIALIAPRLMGGTVGRWDYLFKSLLFIPYLREDGLVRPILFVGWSLNLEMLFYLIFAVTLLVRNEAQRVWIGVGALLTLIALGQAFSLPAEIAFLTQPILIEFASGMIVGLFARRLPTSHVAGFAAMAVAPFAFVCLLTAGMVPLPWHLPLSVLPATAMLVCALIAERGGFRLHWPVVILLGNASYALYLVHPIVTQAIIKAAQRLGLVTAASAPVGIVVAICASILAGVIVHLAVEKRLSAIFHRKPAPNPGAEQPIARTGQML